MTNIYSEYFHCISDIHFFTDGPRNLVCNSIGTWYHQTIVLASIMGPFLASSMVREQKEHPTNKMAREKRRAKVNKITTNIHETKTHINETRARHHHNLFVVSDFASG